MKNWFIAIVFILLIGFAAFQTVYLNHIIDELVQISAQAQAEYVAGDQDKSLATSKELLNQWNTHKEMLSALVDHSELHNIHTEMMNLLGDMSANNSTQIPATFARLNYSLEHIKQMDMLSLGNIF